jgi:hypothetical protein
MLGRLTWVLPAAFVAIAVVYAVVGQFAISSLYFGVALGLALHAMGVRQSVAPLQWFGAAIAAFAVVVLLWVVLG